MQRPFISVIIPTYNSGNFIAKTLEKVFSQTYNNYEVIVSDDGSADNTVGVVKSFFLENPSRKKALLINKHEGPGAARNKGIVNASGDWVSFLDSDDLWSHNKLERVVGYILENEGVDLVCHSVIVIEGPKENLMDPSKYFNNKIDPFLSMYRENCLYTSALTIKKSILYQAGLFDNILPSSQDYDLWLRLGLIDKIKMGFIEDPLSTHILREGNISSNVEIRLQCMLEISRKYYAELKKVSKVPKIERTRFEGRIYSSVGLKLLRRKNIAKGIYYLFIGLLKWPFRYDWICKLSLFVKRTGSR
jgi:glycosyltransferase involved in cell wall biosynthesis